MISSYPILVYIFGSVDRASKSPNPHHVQLITSFVNWLIPDTKHKFNTI